MTDQYTWEIAPCQEGAGFTLRENESGQLMHSTVGPWVEANAVYVAQSDFGHRGLVPADPDGSGDLVIYDIGMGIAANALAAFSALETDGRQRPIRMVSFEKHPEALKCALKSPDRFEFLAPYIGRLEELLERGRWASKGEGMDPNRGHVAVSWDLITGDFRATDISTLPQADLIYFDFYAPSACPELWSVEIFSRLLPKLKPSGLLITYSATKAVRAAMLLAGFFIGQGVSTEMKKETTVASLSFSSLRSPLGYDWLKGLDRSPNITEEVRRLIRSHPQFSGR